MSSSFNILCHAFVMPDYPLFNAKLMQKEENEMEFREDSEYRR